MNCFENFKPSNAVSAKPNFWHLSFRRIEVHDATETTANTESCVLYLLNTKWTHCWKTSANKLYDQWASADAETEYLVWEEIIRALLQLFIAGREQITPWMLVTDDEEMTRRLILHMNRLNVLLPGGFGHNNQPRNIVIANHEARETSVIEFENLCLTHRPTISYRGDR